MDDDGVPLRSAADASLLQRAAEGDQEAGEQLVNKYSPVITAIAGKYNLTLIELAKVAQNTWQAVVEDVDRLKLEHPDRFDSWFAATARNECLRILAAR
jgi:DNA-directed RNA polymerase specialized sigma24 family protein